MAGDFVERIRKFAEKGGKVKIEFFPCEKNASFDGENRVFRVIKIFQASHVF